MENEEHTPWDEVAVGADDRTLTFRGIHPGPWAQAPGTWWAYSRALVEWFDEAVTVQLNFVERPPGHPDALVEGDPKREVTLVLDEPLAGRVVIDGCARLVAAEPTPGDSREACELDRVRRVDDRTLVVYWMGGAYFPLDHVSTEWKRRSLVLTVWIYGGGGKAVGSYDATIVRLDQPLGSRRVANGARRRLRRG